MRRRTQRLQPAKHDAGGDPGRGKVRTKQCLRSHGGPPLRLNLTHVEVLARQPNLYEFLAEGNDGKKRRNSTERDSDQWGSITRSEQAIRCVWAERPPKNARSFYFLAVLAVIQTSIANFLPSNGGADVLGYSDTGYSGTLSL